MLIGSPRLEKVCLHLPNGRNFCIRKEGQGIYVKQAVLNGRELCSMAFSVDEMINGGELVITMTQTVDERRDR